MRHSEETCSHYFIIANTPSRSEVRPVSWLVFILRGSRPQQYHCDQMLPASIHTLTYKTVLDLSFLNECIGSKRGEKRLVSHRVIERAPTKLCLGYNERIVEWFIRLGRWIFKLQYYKELNIWWVSQELNSSSIFTDVYEMCSGFHYCCIQLHVRTFFSGLICSPRSLV